MRSFRDMKWVLLKTGRVSAKSRARVSRRLISREHKCVAIAIICFITTACWPTTGVYAALIAFLTFCIVLWNYRSGLLTNLVFLFAAVTVFVLLSSSLFNTFFASLGGAGAADFGENESVGLWTTQYIALAVESMVLGACLLKWNRNLDATEDGLRRRVSCTWIYLLAAFVPLILNVILYYVSLRGQDYVEIHKTALGPEKYVLFLTFATHGAFIRLFAGWNHLKRIHRLALATAVCLFLYVYVFLLPLRTNLFMFGMYGLYFFGGKVRWYAKFAIVAAVLLLFSWMAMARASSSDALQDMGFGEGTLSALAFGPVMADMVPWADHQVQSNGAAWGATSLLELVSIEYSPSYRYVEDKFSSYAETGGGYGFFYLAELLLNFSYWGGLVGVCLLGAAFQKLSDAQGPFIRLTVLPALLATSFPLMRNDFMTTLKVPLYIAIACLILDRMAAYGRELGGLREFAGLRSTGAAGFPGLSSPREYESPIGG
jgi:O-antigen polysaccharide polymerase Wzy